MEQLTLSLILRKFYVRNRIKGGNLEAEGCEKNNVQVQTWGLFAY